jgi:hypothetical protein
VDTVVSSISGFYADPVQDLTALANVLSAQRQDKQIRLVEDVGALYRFDFGASSGGIVPSDVDDGRWFKVQAATQDHNTLINLQGGTTNEYYHLTATEHSGLTGSGATALHTHSHANLTNLSADDHTQYALVAGTRAFTGKVQGVATSGGDPSTTLATKGYVDSRPLQTHATTHEVSGSDEINVGGLSGVLLSAQKVNVLNGATLIGTRVNVSFSGGVTVTDNPGQNRVDVNVTGGSGVDASTTVKGNTKLTTAPTVPTDPIAVSATDPRMLVATDLQDGLFAKEDRIKLDTIEPGARNHPTFSSGLSYNAITNTLAVSPLDLQNGGSLELSVAGLSGQLADRQLVRVQQSASTIGTVDTIDFTGAGVSVALISGRTQVTIPIPSHASSTVEGTTKLTLDPAVSTNPIAVGANDPRMSIATDTQDGLFAKEDRIKLDTIEPGAQTHPAWSNGLTYDGLTDTLTVQKTDLEDGGPLELDVTGLSGQLADIQKVAVQSNASVVASRTTLNFRNGLVATDDSGNGRVNVAAQASDSSITVASGGVSVALRTSSGLQISSGLGILLDTNPGLALGSGGVKVISGDSSITVGASGVVANLNSTGGLQTSSGLGIKLASNSGLSLSGSGLTISGDLAGHDLTDSTRDTTIVSSAGNHISLTAHSPGGVIKLNSNTVVDQIGSNAATALSLYGGGVGVGNTAIQLIGDRVAVLSPYLEIAEFASASLSSGGATNLWVDSSDHILKASRNGAAYSKVILQSDLDAGAAKITVKDEGTNVTNTPHATLNFTGAGVTVTDGGGGVATVTIPDATFTGDLNGNDLTDSAGALSISNSTAINLISALLVGKGITVGNVGSSDDLHLKNGNNGGLWVFDGSFSGSPGNGFATSGNTFANDSALMVFVVRDKTIESTDVALYVVDGHNSSTSVILEFATGQFGISVSDKKYNAYFNSGNLTFNTNSNHDAVFSVFILTHLST